MGRAGKDGEPDPASHSERGRSLEGLGQMQQLALSSSQGREGQKPGQERKLLALTDCFPKTVPLKLPILRVFLELWHLFFNKWSLIPLPLLGRNRKQTATIEELSVGPDQGTEVMTRHRMGESTPCGDLRNPRLPCCEEAQGTRKGHTQVL